MSLTRERLSALLDYNPDTGQFMNRVSRRRVAAGSIAGTVNARGYRLIAVDCRRYLAHRLAWYYMTGVWPRFEIDHRDGDTSNNRWRNLREATRAQNQRNVRKHRDNRSGFKGVSRDKRTEKWLAKITFEGRPRRIGLFNTPEEAAAAYDREAQQLFGEFKRAA